MPLCLGFRHASVDYRLIEDSFGPACIHSTPAAGFFSCSKGQIRLGLVGTEEEERAACIGSLAVNGCNCITRMKGHRRS